jgi:dephospho-CoA kinase
MYSRIVIVGGPKVGKTTAADAIARVFGHTVMHTDDLISTHSWGDVPDAILEWFELPGPWVVEGVQTARALRRWFKSQPRSSATMNLLVDAVVNVTRPPFVPLSRGQESMAKGVAKIFAEVEPRLTCDVFQSVFDMFKEWRNR